MICKRIEFMFEYKQNSSRFMGFLLLGALLVFGFPHITAAAQLIEEGSLAVGSYGPGIAVSGNYAYLADGVNFEVVDITDMNNPTIVARVSMNYARDVAISGNYAYVADSSGPLIVFDISDPTNPTQVETATSAVTNVVVDGTYLYVALGNTGTAIF